MSFSVSHLTHLYLKQCALSHSLSSSFNLNLVSFSYSRCSRPAAASVNTRLIKFTIEHSDPRPRLSSWALFWLKLASSVQGELESVTWQLFDWLDLIERQERKTEAKYFVAGDVVDDIFWQIHATQNQKHQQSELCKHGPDRWQRRQPEGRSPGSESEADTDWRVRHYLCCLDAAGSCWLLTRPIGRSQWT